MTKGLVRLRLSRFGRTNQPIYNIVVTKARIGRDQKPIEVIGTYNPIAPPAKPWEDKSLKPAKHIELDFERAKYWLSVGAQPSDTVTRLLKKAEIWF
ncbi:hypothetical protein WICPIJ_007182 [Wickerhamomyces pijperi]|uniref:Ribosomal protein S16 domain-containing protein n=1 Tax=Wickerhamomyces pijperi TaxID=599730 RepID=A0A9P8TKP8_WICPI|nr:hypothetical protein WICPIJ_007182 [Wickerhamomyces pijperi]